MSDAGGRERPHVLLGVSGAIAAYKAADVVRGLRASGADVTVAVTANATHFVTPFLLGNLSGRATITDQYDTRLSDVHHVDLALDVGLLLVAPATADVLAKMAAGIADDFLTTFYLATPAPVLVAPAMNSRMWQHPATRANVATLRARGVQFVGPVEGELATLHRGIGRLAEPADVVAEALRLVGGAGPLHGEVVLVTAGRTEEPLDLVRTITNRSSGRMGFALAAAAHARGAEVVLVTGPTELAPPAQIATHRVRTAAEMRERVQIELARATVVIMCAAVSDFRPAEAVARKVRKDEVETPKLELVRTPDILAELGREKGARLLVGFAAEDADVAARAAAKLREKNLDLIVGNDISGTETGFAADLNEVVIVDAGGVREAVSKRPKPEVAARVIDHVAALVGERLT